MKTAITILLLILPAAAGAQVDSIGACCYVPHGAVLDWCEDTTEAHCNSLGGTWHGPCSECGMAACYFQQGTCCLPDGTCIMATEEHCMCLWGGTEWTGYPDCAMQESYCMEVSSVPDDRSAVRRELTWGKLKTLYR